MIKNIFIFEKYIKKNNSFRKFYLNIKFIKKYQPLRFFIILISIFYNPFNNYNILTLNVNSIININLEYNLN